MNIQEKLSRFVQGTAVVLALGMLLVIGGFVYAQKIIELPDFSFSGGDDGVEFTEFKEAESTPESIREALEVRLVDPLISAFIEEDLRFFRTAQDRGSDVLTDLEQSYHNRTMHVIHLRTLFAKQIVPPLLDLTPEQKNKTIVISNHVRGTPKKNGGISISMVSGLSFEERLSIELNDLSSVIQDYDAPYAEMLSLDPNPIKVYELPDIEFVAAPLSHARIKVKCTNVKYAPPQQGGGGTYDYIWTQITGDCKHNFRVNYSEDSWEIMSSNKDTWIWEIKLVDNTDRGASLA